MTSGEMARAARTEWQGDIAARYPADVPTVTETRGSDDPAFVEYLTRSYLEVSAATFQPPDLLEPGAPLTQANEVQRWTVGVHRKAAGEYAGSDKTINLHPVRMQVSPEDAAAAEYWATQQMEYYPRENNAARNIANTHALIVRVEWGADPAQPYEIDTEPSGYGLLALLSPPAREQLVQHRTKLGLPLWAFMPDHRVNDSMEHLAAPLALPGDLTPYPNKHSGLLLPFMGSPADMPREWHQQSILPVEQMEDKAHQALMGLARIASTPEQVAELIEVITNGSPTMVRELVGSCAQGMEIFKGDGALRVPGEQKGLSTKSKTLKFIEEAASAGKSLLWTPFKRPATPDEYGVDLTNAEVAEFGGGDPSKLRAIKRLFVAIHPDRTAECIGGFINLRRNEKVHGANDTLFIVCDPPQR